MSASLQWLLVLAALFPSTIATSSDTFEALGVVRLEIRDAHVPTHRSDGHVEKHGGHARVVTSGTRVSSPDGEINTELTRGPGTSAKGRRCRPERRRDVVRVREAIYAHRDSRSAAEEHLRGSLVHFGAGRDEALQVAAELTWAM